MVSTEKKGRSPARKRKTQSKTDGAASTSSWIDSFGQNAQSFESAVDGFVRERPFAVLGGAVGLGLVGYFLVQKMNSAAPGRSARKSGMKPSGALSKKIGPALEQFQSEFERLPFDGIASVRTNISKLVTQEISERPWETLGAALAFGFGLGNVDREQVKRGAIRLVQMIAVKSLDDIGGRSSVAKLSQSSNPNNPEGARNEYDQNQHH